MRPSLEAGASPTAWPGPGPDLPTSDVLEPLSAGALAIHATGIAANATAAGVTLVALAESPAPATESWPLALGGVAAGLFVADFISGALHWAFDTWFSEDVRPLRRMVFIVREHHLHPERIHGYRLRDEAGALSWFALGGAAPFYLAAFVPGGIRTGVDCALASCGLAISAGVVLALQFHKCGHRPARSRIARRLQRMRVLLGPEVHLRHHRGEHDEYYCIVNGWADMTLGRIGVWRALERVVSTATGAVPRANDHEWAERYTGSRRRRRRR